LQNKANLPKAQTNVSFCFRRAYEENDAWAVPKNKAKQSQFYIFTAENAESTEERSKLKFSACSAPSAVKNFLDLAALAENWLTDLSP